MIIGVLKEPNNETRVSLLPEHIAAFAKLNVRVLVECEAGLLAYATDDEYTTAGASCLTRQEVLQQSTLILCINPLTDLDVANCKARILLGLFQPLFNAAYIKTLAALNFTVFSIDMLPRSSRAQSMDVLSSQANIAGYKAVLLAANMYPRYFPMFMTAAGSIPPAKMLILGAGVAGLQAIATAKRLGAIVEVFDTRPQVKEEVMSLGAKFVEVDGAISAKGAGGYAVEQSADFLEKQKARIAESVAKCNIIITTAAIPGKKAPILITEQMIASMKSGSVIIDLAAATGGNTAHTKNNETVLINGVTIVGQSNLPATMPSDASKMYGKNMVNFLQLLINKEGTIQLNFADDIVKGTCVAHEGSITNDRVAMLV